jgi:uncharacterized spore protein YtfJ
MKGGKKEMEEVQNLIKTCLGEIERVLTTRTVVGEPITVEGNTIIPLVKIGFGFGGGGGSGKGDTMKGEGTGAGTGAGGGIEPVAVIVVSKDGVRVEPVKGKYSFVEKIADVAGKVMEKREEKKQEEKRKE